jgi:hypothetical protein
MKSASSSGRFYSNSRLLFALLVVLLTGCVLLIGLGAISRTLAARIGSLQAVSTASALSYNYGASNSDPARRLNERGNRLGGLSFLPVHPRNTRALRPAGNGDWFSLGPPGGDVFNAAASTADPGIALAGIAAT